MLRDNKPQGNFSQGDFNQLESGKSINKVIEHIKKLLPHFINKVKTKKISVEKGLNHLCVRVMDNHDLFQFMHEDLETPSMGNSPAIDIGIYTRGDGKARFFAFEGKRLDTSIQNYNTRKKEYVVNNNGGGIERFKKDIHGKELLLAGMLGYVQTDNFDIWLARINGYIGDEIGSTSIGVAWNSDDLLELEQLNTVYATYRSKHLRSSDKEIDLYHLWVDLQ